MVIETKTKLYIIKFQHIEDCYKEENYYKFFSFNLRNI